MISGMLRSDMLDRLFALLGGPPQETPKISPARDLHWSAAVLLGLAAGLDGRVDATERESIVGALTLRFGLAPSQAEALVEEAKEAAAQATDLFSLTHEINKHVHIEDRVTIIEMLWEVAYADGTLHDYEANLVRRVAGLLYVTDQASGAARKRVLERLQAGSTG